jgi:hypothetical protein
MPLPSHRFHDQRDRHLWAAQWVITLAYLNQRTADGRSLLVDVGGQMFEQNRAGGYLGHFISRNQNRPGADRDRRKALPPPLDRTVRIRPSAVQILSALPADEVSAG